MGRQRPSRFLIVHGRADERVAFETSVALSEKLTAAGHAARLSEHPGGHAIPKEAGVAAAAFLTETN